MFTFLLVKYLTTFFRLFAPRRCVQPDRDQRRQICGHRVSQDEENAHRHRLVHCGDHLDSWHCHFGAVDHLPTLSRIKYTPLLLGLK